MSTIDGLIAQQLCCWCCCDAARRIPAPSTYPAETPPPIGGTTPATQHCAVCGRMDVIGVCSSTHTAGRRRGWWAANIRSIRHHHICPTRVQRRCLQLRYRHCRPTQPRRPTHRPGSARQGSCRSRKIGAPKGRDGRTEPNPGRYTATLRRYLTAVEGGAGRPPPHAARVLQGALLRRPCLPVHCCHARLVIEDNPGPGGQSQ